MTKNSRKNKPYLCPRCEYATSDLNDMRRHLYLKKKPCPATKNVIDLTDKIKQHILDNRIYKIDKRIKKTTHEIEYVKKGGKPASVSFQNNYIYLLREREFIKTDEPIYKIGKTIQSNMKRVKEYPKGSELICYIKFDNCHEMEKILINMFKSDFIQRLDIGIEYFQGNHKIMEDLIYKQKQNENSGVNYIECKHTILDKNMKISSMDLIDI